MIFDNITTSTIQEAWKYRSNISQIRQRSKALFLKEKIVVNHISWRMSTSKLERLASTLVNEECQNIKSRLKNHLKRCQELSRSQKNGWTLRPLNQLVAVREKRSIEYFEASNDIIKQNILKHLMTSSLAFFNSRILTDYVYREALLRLENT